MFKWPVPFAAIALGLAVGLHPTVGHSEDMNVIIALPAQTLTFSSAFIAEDAGYYKKEGLNVTHRFITGVGSPNAVLAGSADFTDDLTGVLADVFAAGLFLAGMLPPL